MQKIKQMIKYKIYNIPINTKYPNTLNTKYKNAIKNQKYKSYKNKIKHNIQST